ncbi:hypothetical protein [Helicobacter sp.]|uniref:hypothetical protein n=1 Tax=Helicobacter sp. TaxID=218 RepID=UPI0025C0C54C|nr:hypothetical protein [Helicobacter sp.]MCI5632706.1 hypothetical protein [Helicobacter sp.]
MQAQVYYCRIVTLMQHELLHTNNHTTKDSTASLRSGLLSVIARFRKESQRALCKQLTRFELQIYK